MKHKLSFLLLYGTLVLFGGLGALVLLFGAKEARASETENRMLAGFPELSLEAVKTGQFMSGLEAYLSDNMPERDELVVQADLLLHRLSLPGTDDDAAVQDALYAQALAMGEEAPEAAPTAEATAAPTPEPTPEPTATPEPAGTATPEPTASPVPTATAEPTPSPKPKLDLATIPNCTFTMTEANGKVRTVYTFPAQNVRRMVEVLNAYRAVLPEDGHMFFAQPPFSGLAIEITNGTCTTWGGDLEDTINAYSDDGVYMISVQKVLEQHLKDKEYLYYKTDHHWTPRAALYVLNAMLEKMGIDPTPYEGFSYRTYKNFYGSASNNNPSYRSTRQPDTLDMLIPATPVKGYLVFWDGSEREAPLMYYDAQTYVAFLGGTQGPWRRFETGVDSGRSCLVIGDSFSNCLTPYLTAYYETVHVTDVRRDYYDHAHARWTISEYIRENGIDDVYFILSTANGVNTTNIVELLMTCL